LVDRLQLLGHSVDVADPMADAAELQRDHGLQVVPLGAGAYDLVVGAVAHAQYRALSAEALSGLFNEGGVLADLKGIWRDLELAPSIGRWSL
jgi:UDP-N-acetyl-D-galactosamine dehydrogenase